MKILTTTLLSTLALCISASAETKKEQAKPAKPAIDHSQKNYPMGFAHKNGFVISPFKPYNVLNVKHLRPGNLAHDPTTALLNPKTGKPDMATAKIFRVPVPKPVEPVTTASR